MCSARHKEVQSDCRDSVPCGTKIGIFRGGNGANRRIPFGVITPIRHQPADVGELEASGFNCRPMGKRCAGKSRVSQDRDQSESDRLRDQITHTPNDQLKLQGVL